MTHYKQYVGGMFEEMANWQFDYVTNTPEFSPNKTFLDIGCGSMRLGAKLIPHMKPGKYWGLDINQQQVEAGISGECGDLDFDKLKPQFVYTNCFDMSNMPKIHFAWCQAVFNHLKLSTISVCLQQLSGVLHPKGVFYSTYWPGVNTEPATDEYNGDSPRDIPHTPLDMANLFEQHGFTCEEIGVTLRGQTIIRSNRA